MIFICFENVTFLGGILLVPKSIESFPPRNALCHGLQEVDVDGDGELRLWSVICDGSELGHGKVPGM